MATADSTVTAEYKDLRDRRHGHAIHAIAAEPDNILVGHNIVSFDAVWWG
jgi:hypothetical protein